MQATGAEIDWDIHQMIGSMRQIPSRVEASAFRSGVVLKGTQIESITSVVSPVVGSLCSSKAVFTLILHCSLYPLCYSGEMFVVASLCSSLLQDS